MPPLAICNHLVRIERTNPKGFICAACPPRTRQAKGQRLKAINLRRGRQEGAGQKQLAWGSLEGVERGVGREGMQGKESNRVTDSCRWYCQQGPTPKHTRGVTSHVL